MVTGKYDSQVMNLITLHTKESGATTRGHAFKLKKPSCSNNTSKHFFTQRVTNMWNNLPREVAEAPTLNAFKNRLDQYWNKLDIKYDFDAAMAKENPFSATGGIRN